jgi:hypothetical protein
MKPDHCDHCPAQIKHGNSIILPAGSPLTVTGKYVHRFNVKIKCQACGKFNPRVVELVKE